MLYFSRWKIALVSLICLAGVAFTLPNFVSRESAQSIPVWLPHNQVNLGLDLQGGLHLLMEVDAQDLLRRRLTSLVGSIRGQLRSERIGYVALGAVGDRVGVTIREPAEFERALALIRELAVPLPFNPITGQGGGDSLVVTTPGERRIEVAYSEEALQQRTRSILEQSIEIVRKRIDELGTREPTIQRQGDERILVQVPGEADPERVKRIVEVEASMVFRMVDVTASPLQVRESGRAPPGSELLESYERNPDGSPAEYYVVHRDILVEGELLTDAQATTDQRTNEPVVSFSFNTEGAKKFGRATQENVGRPFAIVLDERVISAPVIREPILGGSGIISGNFSFQEANDLALLLRAGALPAKFHFVEERTVGPTLGADSIRAGSIASMVGFVAVAGFMIAAYGLFGIASVVALAFNMFMIVGALSGLGATLTLPGIAGIVLTIGMAVDANVLVFERVREEVRTGKTPFAAMEAGYRRAMDTIVDANLTTFFAAAILFVMGSGPIKGFAVTLAIGIVTSVFTAVLVTRMFLVLWLRRARPSALPI